MITGVTAKLTLENKKIAYITGWTVDNTREMLEISTLGMTDKEVLPGVKDWSASADGLLAFTDADGNNSNQKAIIDAMKNGEVVKFEFVLDTEIVNNTERIKNGFEGSALIESVSIEASASELPKISISIAGVGELLFVEYTA